MKFTYYFDRLDISYHDFGGTDINPGDKVLMYVRRDLMTGSEEWRISKAFAEGGYPGNLDHSIKAYHGWRGTTDNVYVEAFGVYTVKSVDIVSKEYPNDTLKVVLNHTDIKRNED